MSEEATEYPIFSFTKIVKFSSTPILIGVPLPKLLNFILLQHLWVGHTSVSRNINTFNCIRLTNRRILYLLIWDFYSTLPVIPAINSLPFQFVIFCWRIVSALFTIGSSASEISANNSLCLQ